MSATHMKYLHVNLQLYVQVPPAETKVCKGASSCAESRDFCPRRATGGSTVRVHITFALFLCLVRGGFGSFIPFLSVFRLLGGGALLPPPLGSAVLEPNLRKQERNGHVRKIRAKKVDIFQSNLG